MISVGLSTNRTSAMAGRTAVRGTGRWSQYHAQQRRKQRRRVLSLRTELAISVLIIRLTVSVMGPSQPVSDLAPRRSLIGKPVAVIYPVPRLRRDCRNCSTRAAAFSADPESR